MWRLIALYNPHAHSRANALYIIEYENFILCNPRKKSIQHFNKDLASPKHIAVDTALPNSGCPQCHSLLAGPGIHDGVLGIPVHSENNFGARVQRIRDLR